MDATSRTSAELIAAECALANPALVPRGPSYAGVASRRKARGRDQPPPTRRVAKSRFRSIA
jgi:hypothetical protein